MKYAVTEQHLFAILHADNVDVWRNKARRSDHRPCHGASINVKRGGRDKERIARARTSEAAAAVAEQKWFNVWVVLLSSAACDQARRPTMHRPNWTAAAAAKPQGAH